MASRNFNPVQALQKELKIISGKISLNASAAVTAPATSGAIPGVTSVTRTSAGLYKITLQDKFNGLLYSDFIQSEDTPGAIVSVRLKKDAVLMGGSNSPNTISFWTLVGTTPTDVIAALDLYFTLHLKNTGL